MTEQIVQYVRIKDVPRFEAEGWTKSEALTGTNHGRYCVLMTKTSGDTDREKRG